METFKILTVLSLLVAVSFMAPGCGGKNEPSPSNSYALDSSQLRATISKAEAGDIDAMNLLVDYYWIYRDDSEKEGLRWLQRAASAGDIEAKKSLVEYCDQHPSVKDCAMN